VVEDANSFQCDPGGCSPSSFVSASFDVSSFAIGADLSASGESAASSGIVYTTFSDSGLTYVTLSDGTYTFGENFYATVNGSGDTQISSLDGEFGLVAVTPEPRGAITFLTLGLLGVVVWMRNRSAMKHG
jgi:hypothetical protein